ncbi:MAG TPA: PAS domain S-box protein [Candidatus Angelobacter sp.]|nr:PAS domain S-box protein [Candidatus Angelobacter sp.]
MPGSLDRGKQKTLSRLSWFTASVSVVTLAVAILAWGLVRGYERNHIRSVTRLITSAVRSDLSIDISTWVEEQIRLAKLWEFAEPSHEQWVYFARLYIEHHPGCESVAWLDPQNEEHWLTGPQGEIAAERHFSSDEVTSRMLKTALATKQAIASNPFRTKDGQRKWLAIVPVDQKDRFRGFVIASFDLQQSLDDMLTDIEGLGFSVGLEEGGQEIYEMAGSSKDNRDLAEAEELAVAKAIWHIQVWPTPAGLHQIRSNLPQFVLGFGVILTALLTWLAYAYTRLTREISERRRAEEAMRMSQARFAGILEISAAAVISTDSDQRITLFNQAAEKIFGYKAGEMLGQQLEILVPEHFRAVHRRHFISFAESGQRNLMLSDHRLVFGRRRDGTEFPMAAQLSKLELGGEKIFTILCSDVTRQVHSEEELLRVHDELETRVMARTAELRNANTALKAEITERAAAEDEVRQLSGKIMRVQDEERRSLARELHDGAAQNLVSVTLTLNRLLETSSQNSEDIQAVAESLRLVEQCATELRNISYLLHPPMLEELGLSRALRGYVEGFQKRSGITMMLNAPQEIGPLDFEVQLTVFRIVQEGLANILKHSHSATAFIGLSVDGDELKLEIADQGGGMHDSNDGPGVGLAGMKERVRLLGGRLSIDTGGTGTIIRATLPLNVGKSTRTPAKR